MNYIQFIPPVPPEQHSDSSQIWATTKKVPRLTTSSPFTTYSITGAFISRGQNAPARDCFVTGTRTFHHNSYCRIAFQRDHNRSRCHRQRTGITVSLYADQHWKLLLFLTGEKWFRVAFISRMITDVQYLCFSFSFFFLHWIAYHTIANWPVLPPLLVVYPYLFTAVPHRFRTFFNIFSRLLPTSKQRLDIPQYFFSFPFSVTWLFGGHVVSK